MASVLIRHLPAPVLAALKRRALRHGRSLQGELKQALEALAREELPPAGLPPIELHLSTSRATGAWGRDEIYGEDGR